MGLDFTGTGEGGSSERSERTDGGSCGYKGSLDGNEEKRELSKVPWCVLNW